MARVLLVTDIFPPQIGGPATFIDRLAHSLASRNHDVTAVCSSSGRRDPSDAARPFAVRRVSLASRERYEIFVRLRLAIEMARHRLIFVNGLERYVTEVNQLLRRRYILKIVGDGPEWPHLVELSAQLGLSDRVVFHGRLSADGVRDAMGRAHALVLTSLYEGLSHTVLEASAAGLPCIVSDRGGNEEVVRHAQNGLVVPPQNVDRLADALRWLGADETFRRTLAASAMETARAFDLADTVTRTEHLLLNGSEAPPRTDERSHQKLASSAKAGALGNV